jgi:zeaxanthin glucosyltransferase
MSTFLFIIDHFESHLLPTFHLGDSLKARDHDVVYMSIADNEQLIRGRGFRFYPFFPDLYPRGFSAAYKTYKREEERQFYERLKTHLGRIMDGEMAPVLAEIAPDLCLISTFLRMEIILLHYLEDIRPVILTTYLRSPGDTFISECVKTVVALPGDISTAVIAFLSGLGTRFLSIKDMFLAATEFHEIVLCPRELDADITIREELPPGHLPAGAERAPSTVIHYSGPSILRGGSPEETVGEGRGEGEGVPLIYASLGSYALYREDCFRFFAGMIEAMHHPDMKEMRLIMAIGSSLDMAALEPLPPNVEVQRWVDQPEVIRRASVVITHGGLGTIKESLFFGVPLIVLPLLFDQPRNAALIVHHRLGLRLEWKELSADRLREAVLRVLGDAEISRGVRAMQQIFRDKEADAACTALVEKLAAAVIPQRKAVVSNSYTGK